MYRNRISRLTAGGEVVETFCRHFACKRCGACCTRFDGVRVTREEMKRLDIPKDEWRERFHVVGDTYYMKQPCPFHSTGKRGCTIYNSRPETCRRFPMYAIRDDDGLLHLAVSQICQAAVEALEATEAEWLEK